MVLVNDKHICGFILKKNSYYHLTNLKGLFKYLSFNPLNVVRRSDPQDPEVLIMTLDQ